MSVNKYIIRIDGCGDELDDEEIYIHSSIADASGDGLLCGLKAQDGCYDAQRNILETSKGLPAIEFTKKPISCPQCIEIIEAGRFHTNRKGKWY